MGFYIRKSLRFGPLRFNLSKSGIGVSAGVKGFRVGTGPRGNYVHAGAGGLYYRATLPSGRPHHRPSAPTGSPIPQLVAEPLADIESADVLSMVDENSASLLAELNEKHKLTRIWPIILTVGLLALVAGVLASQTAVLVVAVVVCLLAIPATHWDARRKTTVLFYDLEAPVLPAVETLHASFDGLRACARAWHIEGEARSSDLKYSAGANTTVRRKVVRLVAAAPPYFKTNVPTPSIPVGRQRLYLLPDRLLVYDLRGVGAVSYEDLRLSADSTRFVESEGVPGDARVVDRTWRYVNKSGGPDRRFRDNPEIPIALYEELTIRSSSGLNEKLQLSRVGASSPFIAAAQQLATLLREAQVATVPHDAGSSVPSPVFSNVSLQPAPLFKAEEPAQNYIPSQATPGDRKFFFFTTSVQGPFSREELTEFHRVGSISSETPICSDDDNRWVPYAQLFSA